MFRKIFLLILITGCSSSNTTESSSELKFRSWSKHQVARSLIAHAREPVINVCLTGRTSGSDLERAKQWSKKAILTWFRAIKVIDRKVTNKIAYTCSNKHITFNLKAGSGTSTASPSRVNVYMNKKFGTWPHELGHALAGLGDTYRGGSAGSCSDMVSLMCWGAYGPRSNPEQYSTLWPDDIAGIQANYRKLFSDLEPPVWETAINLEGPFDADHPWPLEDGEQPTPQPIDPIKPDTQPDSDGDGVPDAKDLCSNTPKGGPVWKSGKFIGCAGGQIRDRRN